MSSSGIPLSLLFVILAGACTQQQSPLGSPDRKSGELPRGAYLGEHPPRVEPLLFAPGVVSTAAFELNSAFTPDGRELYQSLVVSGWSFSAITERREGTAGWDDPEVAPFSGRYNDLDPNLSPDGNSVFFISRRPETPFGKELSEAWDIWKVSREDQSSPWGEAVRLPEPVNSPAAELYPSVSSSGTIYFGSKREGGFGGFDIYRAKLNDQGYGEAENLGARINSEHAETDAFIAPDESFLVVTVTGRPDSRGKNDLYISFSQEDGSWGELHHMGHSINSPAKEYCPVITSDGKYFFFTRGRDDSLSLYSDEQKTYRELAEMTYSWRNNLENIYWVSSEVLQRKVYE